MRFSSLFMRWLKRLVSDPYMILKKLVDEN